MLDKLLKYMLQNLSPRQLVMSVKAQIRHFAILDVELEQSFVRMFCIKQCHHILFFANIAYVRLQNDRAILS